MPKNESKTINPPSFFQQSIEYRNLIHSRNSHKTINNSDRDSNSISLHLNNLKTNGRLVNDPLFTKLNRSGRNIGCSLSLSKQANKESRVSSNLGLEKVNVRELYEKGGTKSNREDMTTPVSQFHLSSIEQPSLKDNKKLKADEFNYLNHASSEQQSLSEIDHRLERLIGKKLQLLMHETSRKKDQSQSVRYLSRDRINQQFQHLIDQIRSVKNRPDLDTALLNKKIRLIEEIMAEQATQSSLMKKYYYRLNSNRKKGKYGDFSYIKSNMADYSRKLKVSSNKMEQQSMQLDHASHHQQSLYQESTNKNSFKEPRIEDYESYRYKHNNYAINLQPLPRSSYRRQYLYMKTSPDEKIINKDNSPYFPQQKSQIASIYEKDYTFLRSQGINYKDLDACKNKIKILQVDYMPRKRVQSQAYDRQVYAKNVVASSSRVKIPQYLPNSENETKFNKHMLVSENQRQYKKQSPYQPSKIKDRQLKDFQYKFKTLFKA